MRGGEACCAYAKNFLGGRRPAEYRAGVEADERPQVGQHLVPGGHARRRVEHLGQQGEVEPREREAGPYVGVQLLGGGLAQVGLHDRLTSTGLDHPSVKPSLSACFTRVTARASAPITAPAPAPG